MPNGRVNRAAPGSGAACAKLPTMRATVAAGSTGTRVAVGTVKTAGTPLLLKPTQGGSGSGPGSAMVSTASHCTAGKVSSSTSVPGATKLRSWTAYSAGVPFTGSQATPNCPALLDTSSRMTPALRSNASPPPAACAAAGHRSVPPRSTSAAGDWAARNGLPRGLARAVAPPADWSWKSKLLAVACRLRMLIRSPPSWCTAVRMEP